MLNRVLDPVLDLLLDPVLDPVLDLDPKYLKTLKTGTGLNETQHIENFMGKCNFGYPPIPLRPAPVPRPSKYVGS